MAQKTSKKKPSKKALEKLIDQTTEELAEVKETLEEIEDFVHSHHDKEDADVPDKTEDIEPTVEEPIAVSVSQRQLRNIIDTLKDERVRRMAEKGLVKTGKNVIIFYEHASRAGDRFRGLIFMLLGTSILVAGTFATRSDLFSLRDIIVPLLAQPFWGRVATVAVGFSLFAYGSMKLFRGLGESVKRLASKKKKPTYIQQKLA